MTSFVFIIFLQGSIFSLPLEYVWVYIICLDLADQSTFLNKVLSNYFGLNIFVYFLPIFDILFIEVN